MDQTDCLPQQISPSEANSDGFKHLPYKVQAFLKAKSLIPCGHFEIISKEYSTSVSPQPDCEKVRWKIHDWSFLDDVISRGHIGFFEAYQDQKFETDNLPLLLRYLLQNNDALGPYLYAKGLWQFI